jgi:hypothetical protein
VPSCTRDSRRGTGKDNDLHTDSPGGHCDSLLYIHSEQRPRPQSGCAVTDSNLSFSTALAAVITLIALAALAAVFIG